MAGATIERRGDALDGVEERLRHIEASLPDLVVNDLVTGLRNGRGFGQALRSEWRRAARTGEALGLVVLDLGSRAQGPAAVGRALADARVRSDDTLAHLGDGRFAALLRSCGPAAAAEVADRLWRGVAMLGPGTGADAAGWASRVPAWGGGPADLVDAAVVVRRTTSPPAPQPVGCSSSSAVCR